MLPSTPPSPPARAEIRPGVWIDSRLALWLETARLLVVADLHWGYAASHRVRGNLLPAWGDDDIEKRLHTLIDDYAPAEMIWLGDVVHAAEGAARAERFLSAAVVPITVVIGNHDRCWRGAGTANVQRAGCFFHHGDRPEVVPAGYVEVVGHHHPAVVWRDGAGGRLKLPALVAEPSRIVLPAFSPWAAGANWTPRQCPDSTLWAIAPHRIFTPSVSERVCTVP
ncbi:metallophosphoesterase [Opitutus sp. ER46]|uniref:metallophosphoesterase n=1 Tax=Opitutus sp. ER46 TaxID=2161864 RepID=UPI000D30D06E|nr:metallophosphoesterase [Opitutus sp. ER46]PTX94310.1 hypothetical protein DB354_11145 [Opitutus sp. ER46]